ncbi:MAG: DivIVA domain-containing protein [Firmicutes bacterium]|nr:DivIVA domain-containing protein [Bacillota bacterium]HOB34416.1 DivIVA domain-containing protein [Bacillota bacterium]HPZ89844.1 DivIVA domain-containing protein [Bacillota bacterium]HQE01140.1 DivIVA domain-containing protein [Bacillota bacterium]
MPLTPMDIHNKEFTKAFRGYDEDEVNEFLDRIVKDYEALIKENEAMKQKIQELSDKLEHYAKIEETLHNAIIVAQQTAKEVKEAALGEADLIRKEAERESRREIEESMARARKVQREIEELVKQAHIFRSRFRSLLEAQLEIINSDDWAEIERFGQLAASVGEELL